MANVNKLKELIDAQALDISALADMLGISRATFYRKLDRPNGSFTVEEASQLCNILHLSNEDALSIFLGL